MGFGDKTGWSLLGISCLSRRAHWYWPGRSGFCEPQNPHRLQDPQRAQRIAIRGVLRALDSPYMTLGAKVINLRLHLLDDPNQIGAVCEVAVVKHQARSIFVRVLIEMIDPAGIEAARSPLDTMHLITLLQQQLRQIAAVLASYARY